LIDQNVVWRSRVEGVRENVAAEVKVQLVEGTTGVASARNHAFVIDRNPEKGGNDLGFTGGEVLFASIGACIMTTMIGAASARDIELTKIEFRVSGEEGGSPARFSPIKVDAVVEGNTSDEELAKLLTIAERGCSVSNTVIHGAPVTVNHQLGAPSVAAS
jgi:putative redox protein